MALDSGSGARAGDNGSVGSGPLARAIPASKAPSAFIPCVTRKTCAGTRRRRVGEGVRAGVVDEPGSHAGVRGGAIPRDQPGIGNSARLGVIPAWPREKGVLRPDENETL